jgi:hypothetical protein
MFNNKIKEYAGVVALVAIVLVLLFGGNKVSFGAVTGVTNHNSLGVTDIRIGTACGDSFTFSGCAGTVINSTGLSSILGTFSGLLTLDAGQLRSYTVATTTTATAVTLKASDVIGYDTISVLQGGSAGLIYTFFASSTASTWLPTAGDMQETCFLNASTTATATLTFAAGTGIDLEIASSTTTGGALTTALPADSMGCFKFVRKAATASTFDIEAAFTRYTN